MSRVSRCWKCLIRIFRLSTTYFQLHPPLTIIILNKCQTPAKQQAITNSPTFPPDLCSSMTIFSISLLVETSTSNLFGNLRSLKRNPSNTTTPPTLGGFTWTPCQKLSQWSKLIAGIRRIVGGSLMSHRKLSSVTARRPSVKRITVNALRLARLAPLSVLATTAATTKLLARLFPKRIQAQAASVLRATAGKTTANATAAARSVPRSASVWNATTWKKTQQADLWKKLTQL